MDKINWSIALPLTGFGVSAVAAGVVLGGADGDAWSGLLIELGVAIGLVAVVVVIERRLLRDVARTAQEVVQVETADLERRILRLEDLDEAHEAARKRRSNERDKDLADFEQSDLSVAAVGKLLVIANEEALIAGNGQIRVRTSDDHQCHQLYFLAFSDPSKVWTIFLDFEPLTTEGTFTFPDGQVFPRPKQTGSTVLWVDQSADEIAIELEDGLRRRNQPVRDFSFKFALTQLSRTIEVMRQAREAPEGSPKRLIGSIEVLINREWALTDHGLENLDTSEAYPNDAMNSILGNPPTVVVPTELRSRDHPLWREATDWVSNQESGVVAYRDPLEPTPLVLPPSMP